MFVEGGILLNACISAFASILAVYVMWKKIIPTVDGFKESKEKLDQTNQAAQDVIAEVREQSKTAITSVGEAVDHYKELSEGIFTVEGPDGQLMVMPIYQHIQLAAEETLRSLGGAYLSAKPDKSELAAHEFKKNGFGVLGLKVGEGLRKGIQLDKYDPMIEMYMKARDAGIVSGPGGPPVNPMGMLASQIPEEWQGVAQGFFGGMGGGMQQNPSPSPSMGNGNVPRA